MESQVLATIRSAPRSRRRPATDPTPDADPVPVSLVRTGLLPAVATGGLLWLCHFPVAWGWLAWLALVPLLVLVRARLRPRTVFLCAWLAGSVFYWPALQWMRVADPRMYATWALLAFYCSLYVPVAVLLVRRLDRTFGLPLVVTLPAVWVALEFVRAHLMTGFPWYFLAHTQHAFLPVIQVADLGGVYAVSLLVAAVNALVFEGLCTRGWFRSLFRLPDEAAHFGRRALALQAAAVGLVLAGSLGYGCWRLSQDEFEVGPRVSLIQGNIEQRIRNARNGPDPYAAANTMVTHYVGLSDRARDDSPDLIVWPETSYPLDWKEDTPGQPNDESMDLASRVAARWKTDLLLGMNTRVLGPPSKAGRYNSAVHIRPDGGFGGRYDKIHCVPYGEYVPLKDTLPFLKCFSPYDFDYSITAGERMPRFELGRYRFGVLICYEDSVAELAREYVRTNPVDFLVNISNDGWFDGTCEHEEHLAICRFRAVECRRSVARAVNMGISAVIDGNGRVVALPGPTWAESKKVAAVLTAAVPIDRRDSPYSRWGDWLPWACGLGVAGGLGGSWLRRKVVN